MKKCFILICCICVGGCSFQKRTSKSSSDSTSDSKIEKQTYYSVVNADTTMANITIIPICRADTPVTEEKKGMTDETLRLLISEFFSTLASIIAIVAVDKNND